MPTYRVKSIIGHQPLFHGSGDSLKFLDEILAELKIGGGLKILTPAEYITDQQRRWYKGVALPLLVKWDENGETVGWWDTEVKRQCRGLALLKKEIFYFEDGLGNKIGTGRLTTKGVGVRNMTDFIEEFLSVAMVKGWPVTAPNPELRKKKK